MRLEVNVVLYIQLIVERCSMNRTITVKGVGSVSARPDHMVVTFTLANLDLVYENAVEKTATQLAEIQDSLEKMGFDKSILKTTDFQIEIRSESIRDEEGNYHRVFKGYECLHYLKLEFDFDTVLLGKVLQALFVSEANPELSIGFSIKDPTAIKEELLRSATENARRRAEILCEASGVRMGELMCIDYNWNELNVRSHTTFSMTKKLQDISLANMQIEPEDIELRDSVTFVWSII